MQANEIRNLSTDDIRAKVSELKRELFNLRFRLATGQLENTARIKIVRKTIARCLTILQEQEKQNVQEKEA